MRVVASFIKSGLPSLKSWPRRSAALQRFREGEREGERKFKSERRKAEISASERSHFYQKWPTSAGSKKLKPRRGRGKIGKRKAKSGASREMEDSR